MPQVFNIAIVAQSGRLQFEALLFMASFQAANPNFPGRVFVAEPQPGPLWPEDPRITDPDFRTRLQELGATFLPFDTRHFGASYPNGNKIELLRALPKGEPFLFFDTDTLITGDLTEIPFDFTRPTASVNCEGTWPKPELYGPGYTAIWRALYDRFGLDFETSLDLSKPDEYWGRYLYFNAGWFFGACPAEFGTLFETYATSIRDDPPPELIGQTLTPWLDQIALPLVIHSLGGGRNTLPTGLLDGTHSQHYRFLPLLFARAPNTAITHLHTAAAPNRTKKLLKQNNAFKRMIYHAQGQRARALFDQSDLPAREQMIRKQLKNAGLWMR